MVKEIRAMLNVALYLAPIVSMLIRIATPAILIELDGSNCPTSRLFPRGQKKLGIGSVGVKAT
jgi:hypothetical protein